MEIKEKEIEQTVVGVQSKRRGQSERKGGQRKREETGRSEREQGET